MKTLDSFIKYLEEQAANHSIYVWGAQGQDKDTISEEWIKERETDDKNAARAIATWKKACADGYGDVLRAFDCSGLAMYYLQNVAGIVSSDMSANSLMGKCETIKKTEVRRGDWVFKKYTSGDKKGQAYHIGYVVDDALNVIEAKGRDHGVVKAPLSEGKWNAYGRPEYYAAEIKAAGGNASAGGNETAAAGLAVGDVVTFTGTKHYTSANATSGKACKGGTAKITQIYKGGKHPYHLVKVAGGGSTVYGWVDTADIQQAAGGGTIKAGSTVRVNKGAKTYTGGGLAAFVYNRDHTVKQVSGDRAVITYGGVVVAAVKLADLTLVKE